MSDSDIDRKFTVWNGADDSDNLSSCEEDLSYVLGRAKPHGTITHMNWRGHVTEYSLAEWFYTLSKSERQWLLNESPERVMEKIPDFYLHYDVCLELMKCHGRFLKRVAYEHRDKKMCEVALKNCPWALGGVPDKFITKKMCKNCVRRDGLTLKYVPEHFRTKKICQLAISQNEAAQQYVPSSLVAKKRKRHA